MIATETTLENSPLFNTPPLTPSQRAVASMAHLLAIIPIWGLVADFWIWHTRREENPEMRFQALQALLLQAIGLLVTVFFAIAQLFFQLLSVLNEGLSKTLCNINYNIWIAVLIALALMALWGAVMMRWRGKFEYPILGRALRREMRRVDDELRNPSPE